MTQVAAQRIKTEPDPFESFYISQGFRIGNIVYLSGQAAIDMQGNIVGKGDFEAQAEQTFRNIDTVLEAAGSSLAKIFKVTIYLTDMGNFPKIVELRQRWFSKPYPADTIVEVRSLALPELMIEIDVQAIVTGALEDA
ncbi:MAG: RidA family protein [Gammaproteobacteria bacterium]